MALYLDISSDDELRIGGTVITLERKSGKRARLKITGTDEVEMTRKPTDVARQIAASTMSAVALGKAVGNGRTT